MNIEQVINVRFRMILTRVAVAALHDWRLVFPAIPFQKTLIEKNCNWMRRINLKYTIYHFFFDNLGYPN